LGARSRGGSVRGYAQLGMREIGQRDEKYYSRGGAGRKIGWKLLIWREMAHQAIFLCDVVIFFRAGRAEDGEGVLP